MHLSVPASTPSRGCGSAADLVSSRLELQFTGSSSRAPEHPPPLQQSLPPHSVPTPAAEPAAPQRACPCPAPQEHVSICRKTCLPCVCLTLKAVSLGRRGIQGFPARAAGPDTLPWKVVLEAQRPQGSPGWEGT